MRICLFWMLLLSFAACNPDKNRRVDAEKTRFTTSDASELFFKNVRQVFYDKTDLPESKLDMYRIGDRSEAEDYPVLNLVIVINWRYDEAYLLTEPNAFLQTMDTLRIAWQDTVQHQSGTYTLTPPANKDAHFKFASEIYRSIQDGQRLSVVAHEGDSIPFLSKYSDREAFRKTMFDYYRLVDLL